MTTTLRVALVIAALIAVPNASAAPVYRLIAWNDLGMHCMDGDYSVYAILPPYNTIHAQLVDANGKLVRTPAGITVTYEAIADPSGSINTSSAKKTNFWKYVQKIFGASPLPDTGLTGNAMPGAANKPQKTVFDVAKNWFTADAIPMTPFDDTGAKNYYPMMRIKARDSSGALIAETDIVLPVSDEMSCRTCHASGSVPAAKPAAGWAWDPIVERDYKLNVVRLHDDRQKGSAAYASALHSMNYNPAGLSATVAAGQPILCGACHASNALGTAGKAGTPALTASIHGYHAHVIDPATNVQLGNATDRSACYRCHPGSTTKCLRGVMGSAVDAKGNLAMQCQSCHGAMAKVGDASRRGWLDEPACQNCHTGTALSNSGLIRYTDAFSGGVLRTPADLTFATVPNTPVSGASLYRFSTGHGKLFCEACHGSTHAELASSELNDNVQSMAAQGYAGTITECTACHNTPPIGLNGPHNMHPVGQAWVDTHHDYADNGYQACQSCHGADLKGTVLSRASTSRTLTSDLGTLKLWRGFQVGCYACHSTLGFNQPSTNAAPVAVDATISLNSGASASVPLNAADRLGTAVSLRMVQQPQHGSVTAQGNTATVYTDPSYEGSDVFTYAASDGLVDSNLAVVRIETKAKVRPQFEAADVRNAASYESGRVSPGQLISIFGTGLGGTEPSHAEINSGGMVERSLGGTRVLFGDIPAPITYASEKQVNAIVPFSVGGQLLASIAVEYNGIRSSPVLLPVVSYTPGVFSMDGSGAGQAAVLTFDEKQQMWLPNSPTRPASRGSIIAVFATGAGAYSDGVWDGTVMASPNDIEGGRDLDVFIGGNEVEVLYAGAAPKLLAGIVQLNVRVPDTTQVGRAVPIAVRIGGAFSAGSTTIVVQ